MFQVQYARWRSVPELARLVFVATDCSSDFSLERRTELMSHKLFAIVIAGLLVGTASGQTQPPRRPARPTQDQQIPPQPPPLSTPATQPWPPPTFPGQMPQTWPQQVPLTIPGQMPQPWPPQAPITIPGPVPSQQSNQCFVPALGAVYALNQFGPVGYGCFVTDVYNNQYQGYLQ
jgi:hypothetical protein